MDLNVRPAKVMSISYKAGDYNPDVVVAHITIENGDVFTCMEVLDNKINSEHFPTPYASLTNVPLNTQGMIFFGNNNGYKHPTFVGFIKAS